MICRSSRSAFLVSIAATVLLCAGCNRSSGTYRGVVKFEDGSSVRSGSIEFRSLDDGSRYASRIASAGGFQLTDQEGDFGCPPGEYEVVVVQIVWAEDLPADAHEHGHTVPRRYADYYTSDLRVVVPEQFDELLSVELEIDEDENRRGSGR